MINKLDKTSLEIEKARKSKERADKRLQNLLKQQEEEKNMMKLSFLSEIISSDSICEYLKSRSDINQNTLSMIIEDKEQ